MVYIRITVEVLFIAFVMFSVTKSMKGNEQARVECTAGAFSWLGVILLVVLITQLAAHFGLITKGIEMDGLDYLVMWGFAYIVSWIFQNTFQRAAS